MGSILDEVIRPDVIAVLRSQSDARSVIEPQPPAFRLPPWNLQPLTPPDPFDPLVIDQPARIPQQRRNLAVAVAAIETSEFNDVGGQPLLVFRARETLRCVERCCPSAAQARRSETCRSCRTCSIQARRRGGLRSFPGQPPEGSTYPASDPRSPCATAHSPSPNPSAALPGPTSGRHIPGASGNTLPVS